MSKAFAALVATLIGVLVCTAAVEVWVRARWDERRGTPGFYVSDAALGQRLRAGYNGWFAGVPVRINNLGFRDPRDYELKKPAGTFRILVFGDSVTFGHGAVYETTYPYLLEGKLEAWRPDVRWEVWNLGVPGYNTGQELAYLREVRCALRPGPGHHRLLRKRSDRQRGSRSNRAGSSEKRRPEDDAAALIFV